MITSENRLLAAVASALMIPSLLWGLLDRGVWHAQAAEYGHHTLSLWSSLTGKNEEGWLWLMAYARGDRAPGVSWVTQPFAALADLTNQVSPSLLLSSVLFHGAALFLIGKVLRDLFPRNWWPVFGGMLFTASTPLFVNLSNQYGTEPLLLLCVCGFYLLAVRCDRTTPLLTLVWLVLLASLALITNVASPLYALLPGLMVVGVAFDHLRRGCQLVGRWRRRYTLLCLAGVGIFLPVSVWYTENLTRIALKFAERRGDGLEGIWGPERTFFGKLEWWFTALSQATFLLWLLLLLGLIWCAAGARIGRFPSRPKLAANRHRKLIIMVAVGQILGCVLVCANFREEAPRFLAGLLPAVALLAAKWVHSVQFSRGAMLAMCLCFGLQYVAVHVQAFSGRSVPGLRSRIPMTVLDGSGERLATLQQALAVMARREDPQTGSRVLSVTTPWLNASTMNYLSAARGYEEQGYRFTSYMDYGAVDANLQVANRKLSDLHARFLLGIGKGGLERLPERVLRDSAFVSAAAGLHGDYERIPFDSRFGLQIYERRRAE